MKTLFERVFNGSDEMFAKAEEEVNKIVAEVGTDRKSVGRERV